MGSLFGQVWLWSLLSFVAGVALTWLVLVRPAKKEIAELEERLLTAPHPQAPPVDRQAERRDPVDDLLDEEPRAAEPSVDPVAGPAPVDEADDRPRSLFERLSPEAPAAETRLLPAAEAVAPVAEVAAPPEVEAFRPREPWQASVPEVYGEDGDLAEGREGEDEPERPAEATTFIPATALAEAIAEVDGQRWPDHDLTGEYPAIRAELPNPSAPRTEFISPVGTVLLPEEIEAAHDLPVTTPPAHARHEEPADPPQPLAGFTPPPATPRHRETPRHAEVPTETRPADPAPAEPADHDTPPQPGPAGLDSTRPAFTDPERAHPEPAHPERAHPEPTGPEPARQEAAVPEPVHPEAADPRPGWSETAGQGFDPFAGGAEPPRHAQSHPEPGPSLFGGHVEPARHEPAPLGLGAGEHARRDETARAEFDPTPGEPTPDPTPGESAHARPESPARPVDARPESHIRPEPAPARPEPVDARPEPLARPETHAQPEVPVRPAGLPSRGEHRPEPERGAFVPFGEPVDADSADFDPFGEPVREEQDEPPAERRTPTRAERRRRDEPRSREERAAALPERAPIRPDPASYGVPPEKSDKPRSLFEPVLTPEDVDDEPPAPPKPASPGSDQPFVPTLAPELLASSGGGLPQRPTRPANGNRTPPPPQPAPQPIAPPPGRPVRPRPVGFSPSTGGRPAQGTTRYQQPEGFNPRSPFGPGSVLPKSDGMAPAPDFQVKATLTGRRYYTDDSANFQQTRADVWFRTVSDAEKAGFRAAP
ncbi:sunset domain-containing protein [Saccharothrix obliqua]|uniref:sunset domain-containing protein n=1 Tax=Saccharothrix obliqua TaxID=2861747 RepID=UPI001C5F26D0|nr:hypothetical protein [Saccharothrix obliqua]MBW4715907.1 hypothetical protein [Saccharothrix obliqua]